MTTKFRSLIYAALMLLPGASFMHAGEPPATPTRLDARIGGYGGGYYWVQLSGNSLIYTAFDATGRRSNRTKVTPTTTQWSSFHRTLDALKVWQWRPMYPSGGMMDGTQWSLEIAFADRAIKTQGDNNYPDFTAHYGPGTAKTFPRYLDAVKILIGGRTFE